MFGKWMIAAVAAFFLSGAAAGADAPVFRIAVLDFTTIDVEGKTRFLDHSGKPIQIPEQCTLKAGDRLFVSRDTQGLVRMIDARDSSRTREAMRRQQIGENQRDTVNRYALHDKVVNGPSRPVIIGAEYLSAYLGKRGDVFGCVDPKLIAAAVLKGRKRPDYPKDFLLHVAEETGANALLTGTVSDLRSKTAAFRGYGIETKQIVHQLDVIVKLVDLVQQKTVYSNVYTGTWREQQTQSVREMDSQLFQTLMKSALQQAAEDLCEVCGPGRKNKVRPSAIPVKVSNKERVQ